MIAKNRHTIGDVELYHRGVLTHTPVGNLEYDSLVENAEDAFQVDIGIIPPEAAHRPDLISNVFYGTPAYWWLLMLVNGVSDPFNGFNPGDRILLPIM